MRVKATDFWKLTKADGFDLSPGRTVNSGAALKSGVLVTPPPSNARAELCTAGVLHASRKPWHTFTGQSGERDGLDRLALFRVRGIPVVEDHRKSGFLELHVVAERPIAEAFGPRGAEVADLLTAIRSTPWFCPPVEPETAVIEALAVDYQ